MRAALLAVLALVLAGCFQMSSVLTVRPDGSATLREEMTLSGMGLMALAAESEDGTDLWSDLDLEARAAALGEGVRLASFEPTEEGMTAVYEIDDVRTLRYSMDESFGSGEAPADLSFVYDFEPAADGAPPTLRVFVPKPAPGKPTPGEPAVAVGVDADLIEGGVDATASEQALGMMRMFLSDARMTVAVEVEGEIAETTARHVDGNRVTLFDLPFDAFIDAMAENPAWLSGGEPDPSRLFQVMNEIEGVRVEAPGSIRVRFQ